MIASPKVPLSRKKYEGKGDHTTHCLVSLATGILKYNKRSNKWIVNSVAPGFPQKNRCRWFCCPPKSTESSARSPFLLKPLSFPGGGQKKVHIGPLRQTYCTGRKSAPAGLRTVMFIICTRPCRRALLTPQAAARRRAYPRSRGPNHHA